MSDLPATLPEELVPFTFLLGSWQRGTHAEHWVAVGDVLYGIAFDEGGRFSVLTIESVGGEVRYVAQPQGERAEIRPRLRSDNGEVVFQAEEQPPLEYSWSSERKLSVVEGAVARTLKRKPARPAPELEEADRAFALDVAARAHEAWVAAFDPGGHQWDPVSGRISPGPAMAEYMLPVLLGKLQWEPLHSGLSPTGELGWTVGSSRFTPPNEQGPGLPGAYVTLWRKQPDGSWKVLFDAGNPTG